MANLTIDDALRLYNQLGTALVLMGNAPPPREGIPPPQGDPIKVSKDWVQDQLNALKDSITGRTNEIITDLTSGVNGIAAGLSKTLETQSTDITKAINQHIQNAYTSITNLLDPLVAKVQVAYDFAADLTSTAISELGGSLDKVNAAITTLRSDFSGALSSGIETVRARLEDEGKANVGTLNALKTRLETDVSVLGTDLKTAVDSIGQGIDTSIKASTDWLTNNLEDVLGRAVRTIWQGIFDTDVAPESVARIINALNSLIAQPEPSTAGE